MLENQYQAQKLTHLLEDLQSRQVSVFSSESRTILAVDDSAVLQTVIKRALASHYQVLVAGNAVDAVNLLYHNQIALLLLDLSMPDVDGLELCHALRSMTQFRNLPIIMLTARDGSADKTKGEIAGSTEYLTKPFRSEELRQVVGKYVSVDTTSNTESKSK